MRCSFYLIILLFCSSAYAQMLVLDKVNDIEIRSGSGVVRQIIPLSEPGTIAVAIETSDYLLGGYYDDVSVLTKDSVHKVFQTYPDPYKMAGIYMRNEELVVLKQNEDFYREVLLLKYDKTDYNLIDSIVAAPDYQYKVVQIKNDALVFFGRSNVEDSLLLHQTINLKDNELNFVWTNLLKDKNISLWSGYLFDDIFLHALANNNIEDADNYLVVKTKDALPEVIKFNSSNPMQNEVYPDIQRAYKPIELINDSIAYVACIARREVDGEYSHRKHIVFSININTNQLNWQYHGIENNGFKYYKPTPNGVHLYYERSNLSRYEFINTSGELVYESDPYGLVRYCTNNDECIVYRNDTLFLKKFGEVLGYYAFENLENYNMLTFHPDDSHHYVSLRQKGTDIMSIYQLRSDTLDTSISNFGSGNWLNIYPNPSNTRATLQLPLFQNYTIEVLSVAGKTVLQQNIKGKKWVLENTQMQPGIYLIKAFGENKQLYNSRLIWLN